MLELLRKAAARLGRRVSLATAAFGLLASSASWLRRPLAGLTFTMPNGAIAQAIARSVRAAALGRGQGVGRVDAGVVGA